MCIGISPRVCFLLSRELSPGSCINKGSQTLGPSGLRIPKGWLTLGGIPSFGTARLQSLLGNTLFGGGADHRL